MGARQVCAQNFAMRALHRDFASLAIVGITAIAGLSAMLLRLPASLHHSLPGEVNPIQVHDYLLVHLVFGGLTLLVWHRHPGAAPKGEGSFLRNTAAALLLGAFVATIVAAAQGTFHSGFTFHEAYRNTPGTSVWSIVAAMLSSLAALVGALAFLRRHRNPEPKLYPAALRAKAWLHLISGPVLLLSLVLTAGERSLTLGLFEPSLGGDPLLHQRMIYWGLHPTLFGMLLIPLGFALGTLRKAHLRKDEQAAFVVFVFFAVLGSGQHLHSSGGSDFAAMVSSAFGLLAYLPLLHLVFRSIPQMRDFKASPASSVAVPMLALVVAYLLGGAPRAALSLAPYAAGGIFGREGLDLLTVLLGAFALGAGRSLALPEAQGEAAERWMPTTLSLLFGGAMLLLLPWLGAIAHPEATEPVLLAQRLGAALVLATLSAGLVLRVLPSAETDAPIQPS